MNIVSEAIQLLDNNSYEIPQPFEEVTFPNNSEYALAQLNSLNKILQSNEHLQGDYCAFMREKRENNFVEEVPSDEMDTAIGNTWYLPHHGDTEETALDLLNCSTESLSKFGVNLDEVSSNSEELLNILPNEKFSKILKKCISLYDCLPN